MSGNPPKILCFQKWDGNCYWFAKNVSRDSPRFLACSCLCSPNRPSVPRSMGEPFAGIGSILARGRDRSLKRLHRPNRFRVWLHELGGGSGFQCHYGLGSVYLNVGLMKPRRGLTPAAGEEKLEVGK